MGHRGIYRVIADGQRAAYYTHWGVASVFSVFRRLQCAIDLKEGEYADKNMIDIFAHLGEGGNYMETDYRADLMFERISLRARRRYNMDFENCGDLEMRITLNFDTNTAFIEHNPLRRIYKYVGNFYIPIDQGLHNLNAVLDYAEKINLNDVTKTAAIFERRTGLTKFYEEARALRDAKEQQKNSGQIPHGNKENLTSSQLATKLQMGEIEIEPER